MMLNRSRVIRRWILWALLFTVSGSRLPVLHAASLGSITLTGVYPRLFTPNGDGYNDKVGFHFDNPESLDITGKIYDVNGAEVATLSQGTDPYALLLWDGKDRGGRTVPSGVFFYQVEAQNQSLTGTVVVAR